MNLSLHFTLEEMCRSDTAARLGLDNTPDEKALKNLHLLCNHILEPIREQLGPVIITSGYRSLALNRAIGSRDHSAHIDGRAVDFRIAGSRPIQICTRIQTLGPPYDQLIHEFGAWVHISCSEEGIAPRREILTIDTRGTRAGILEIRP